MMALSVDVRQKGSYHQTGNTKPTEHIESWFESIFESS